MIHKCAKEETENILSIQRPMDSGLLPAHSPGAPTTLSHEADLKGLIGKVCQEQYRMTVFSGRKSCGPETLKHLPSLASHPPPTQGWKSSGLKGSRRNQPGQWVLGRA